MCVFLFFLSTQTTLTRAFQNKKIKKLSILIGCPTSKKQKDTPQINERHSRKRNRREEKGEK